jgi:phospholipid-binding lipoprotein MlaA
VVPRLARTGVENFFHNLGAPLRFATDLLRLKPREAGVELGRFMINSTWGVLGFGDLFAGNPEATIPDSDFGLALGHMGIAEGPYIVWPFLGPSTLRDSVGLIGDFALDPITYLDPITTSVAVRAGSRVNATSFRIGDYESLTDAALDPYLAVRDAYLQYRAKKVRE